MDDHEDIKQLCVKILNYYGILGDTEFVLPTNERVDVVGYKMHENEPVIGIEVELTSDLQHDASKLANTSSFQLRIIASNISDTLSLGKTMDINGKIIHIMPPPDKDIAFEKKIREFTNQEEKIWYNEWLRRIKLNVDQDPLTGLEKEIEEQGLDLNIAKDVIFRCALGGIEVGYYRNTKKSTEFVQTSDIPKEIMYLSARHLINGNMIGENYESGKYSVYSITQEGKDIADAIIRERVRNRKDSVDEIIKKFGISAVLISFLGHMGKFMQISDDVYSDDLRYSGIPLGDFYSTPRDIVEEFNIDDNLFRMCQIIANTPLFRPLSEEIYKSFVTNKLGNISKYFTSRGTFRGYEYRIPFRSLLRVMDLRSLLNSLDRNALMVYCEWVIFRSHNPSVPQTLYSSIAGIGSNIDRLRDMVEETFKAGITSKLLGEQSNTIAIYDAKKFNDFCESKMKEVLPYILEKDDE